MLPSAVQSFSTFASAAAISHQVISRENLEPVQANFAVALNNRWRLQI